MKIRTALIAIACLAFAPLAFAQAEAPPRPPAKIADVAWLQGYWVGEGLGGIVEDVWLPPKDGVLLGAFRLQKHDGSKGFYELFAIEEFEGSLRFVVKHFNPDWVGWEEKDQALKLRLTRIAPREAVFGGIRLRLEGDDVLIVEIVIRAKDGSSRQEVLRYKKRSL